jgi:hypothetical protein
MPNNALSAALKMTFNGNGQKGSFFPGARLADDRSDLNDMLGQSPETGFLQKGKAPTPTPTPTPGAVKPQHMNLAQLMDHFGVKVADNQNVMIPQTGAAKYWYVDPRATGVPSPTPNPVGEFEKSGVVPKGQNPQVNDWRASYGWGSGFA